MTVPEHPKGALPHGNIADELARGQRNLEVVVVSPARPIFEGQAHWVTLPTWSRVGGSGGRRRLYGGAPRPERLAVGQIGIWPGHAPIVAALGSGLLRIGLGGDRVTRFAVRGGFLEVSGNKVTVLVDQAVAEAEVDQTEARHDLDETLAKLQHPGSNEEFAELLDRRTWSESRLKLAGAAPRATGH